MVYSSKADSNLTRDSCSWAETLQYTPPGSNPISRRPSNSQQSSAPDIDRTTALLPLVQENAEEAVVLTHGDFDAESRQGASEDTSDSEEKKESVYLDASEENPSMTEILKQLRELPEPTPVVSLDAMTLGIPLPSHTTDVVSTSHEPPVDESRVVNGAQRAILTTRPSPRSPRKRSRARQSFSSIASVHRPAVTPGTTDGSGGESKVEAVVELHEESAAAFQDFLFWCYPQ